MTESEFQAQIQQSLAPYRIQPGTKPFPDGSVVCTLNDAVAHLKKSLDTDFEFDSTRVIESKNWWYIPFVWIGCRGYIVDKIDGYINQLGSCHPLELCFWAHERYIKYSYSNLTVTRINNLPATIATLKRMGNRAPINPIPNKSDADGNRTKFLTDSDIQEHLATLPSTFENQFLWFTIPALKAAAESDAFDFFVTRGSWDADSFGG